MIGTLQFVCRNNCDEFCSEYIFYHDEYLQHIVDHKDTLVPGGCPFGCHERITFADLQEHILQIPPLVNGKFINEEVFDLLNIRMTI